MNHTLLETPVATANALLDIYRSPKILVEMIAQVSGMSRSEVLLSLSDEHRQLGSSVWKELKSRGIKPYCWSDDLIQFYQNTNAFLFESLVWNRSALKQQMRMWITDFLRREFSGPARVLVFGDGLGFDSAWLTLSGHQVTYFEVSSKAIDFARQLFDYHDCAVEMLHDESELESNAFDAVVCLDVLEHVPNPSNKIQVLASAIHSEGCVIVHAPFWYLAPSVGTHLRDNRQFSGDVRRLYQANGLRSLEASLFWNPIALAKSSSLRTCSWQSRVRIAMGGSLLKVGRVWCLPHILISKFLLSRSFAPWPQLEKLLETAAT